MNKFDKHIQELLNSYTEQPSADCWDKIASQLDMMQMPDTNTASSASSGGNTSYFSQFMGSVAGKVVSAVVAAAMIGGVIALVVVNLPENNVQTDNELAVITEEIQNEYVILNEENIQNTTENTPLVKENGNTDSEKMTNSSDEYKNTSIDTDNSVLNTTQNVAVNQTVQQETENTAKVETTSKTENKTQPVTKEPKKRAFADNNKTDFVEDIAETEDTPQNKIEPPKFIIPNIFTPNGDGIHDYFVIEGIEQFSENHLYISNRYGTVVYEKQNYRNNWGAENLPDGVYFYIFKYVYQGTQFMRNGSVTVKR